MYCGHNSVSPMIESIKLEAKQRYTSKTVDLYLEEMANNNQSKNLSQKVWNEKVVDRFIDNYDLKIKNGSNEENAAIDALTKTHVELIRDVKVF